MNNNYNSHWGTILDITSDKSPLFRYKGNIFTIVGLPLKIQDVFVILNKINECFKSFKYVCHKMYNKVIISFTNKLVAVIRIPYKILCKIYMMQVR